MRHAAGESADALQFLGLHITLLRFVQRILGLACPVSFAREPQGLPAGEHEQQCEDQRDRDQSDLPPPGIEERLNRCQILAGHVAPLLENPREFAFISQHSDLLANGIGYSVEFECGADAETRADLRNRDPTQLVAAATNLLQECRDGSDPVHKSRVGVTAANVLDYILDLGSRQRYSGGQRLAQIN